MGSGADSSSSTEVEVCLWGRGIPMTRSPGTQLIIERAIESRYTSSSTVRLFSEMNSLCSYVMNSCVRAFSAVLSQAHANHICASASRNQLSHMMLLSIIVRAAALRGYRRGRKHEGVPWSIDALPLFVEQPRAKQCGMYKFVFLSFSTNCVFVSGPA